MGSVEETPSQKRFWVIVFVAGLIAGLILRIYLAGFAKMPGHGDSAFYFTVAKNIAEGRGPVVDYIVYFFGGLLPLPHYAGDFWNPTASFLIAMPMLLFGKSISVALIAPILAGIVPAVAGFLAGRTYSGSYAVAALTGILTFFSAFLVWFSVTTEAIIFAGAFGSMALYFMMRRDASGRYFLLAALFTGLANLIRQDYILLLVTLEVCILLLAIPRRKKITLAAAALGIHLLVVAPLLLLNYTELHTVFPAGPGKTAFLTTYEDFHSYNKQIDWPTLRATWGISGIVKRRLHTAGENLNQVQYFLTPLLTLLIVAALRGCPASPSQFGPALALVSGGFVCSPGVWLLHRCRQFFRAWLADQVPGGPYALHQYGDRRILCLLHAAEICIGSGRLPGSGVLGLSRLSIQFEFNNLL